MVSKGWKEIARPTLGIKIDISKIKDRYYMRLEN